MLIVVSPAKALDFESPLPTSKHSQPILIDRSEELVGLMAEKSPDQLSKMMSISASLADLNHERFQDWTTPFTPDNARPAVLAFDGDTYTGLDAACSFSERDYTHSQKVLRILSGLHGVLRPLDLIQPYRLEMGSKLTHDNGGDLYSYWGDEVTDQLNAALAESPGAKVLVNLASNEYFSVVQPERFDGRIITPRSSTRKVMATSRFSASSPNKHEAPWPDGSSGNGSPPPRRSLHSTTTDIASTPHSRPRTNRSSLGGTTHD